MTLVQDGDEANAPRLYRGASMGRTFRPGDALLIDPVPIGAIRVGDVVVFSVHDGNGASRDIVHRVVGLCPEGLVTRGDSNRFVDREPVGPGALIGRVSQIRRGNATLPVDGGSRGVARAWWSGARTLLRRFVARMLRRPYHWLRRSGVARRLWRPRLRLLVVQYERGEVVKAISRGRTVAEWTVSSGRFVCRKPYDLVLRREDLE